MKYYKSPSNEVFAFPADGSDDVYIAECRPDLIRIDEAEADELRKPAQIPYAVLAEEYLTMVRATREDILNRITGIGFAAQAIGDVTSITAIKTARQALLDITKAPDVIAATDLAGLRGAVLTEYQRIAAATPLSVQKAFAGVDL